VGLFAEDDCPGLILETDCEEVRLGIWETRVSALPEILRKYWALLLGAMLVGFFGFRLCSGPAPRAPRTGDLIPGEQVPGTAEPDPGQAESTTEPADNPERAPGAASEAPASSPNTQIVEMLIPLESPAEPGEPPRTLTQDSPEVKAALAEMNIEIYAAPGSADADAAQEFLSHNHLKYTVHDTGSDAMAQERARRLSHAPTADQATIVVVDGQVMRGYKADGMQDLLRSATMKRVLSENQAQ